MVTIKYYADAYGLDYRKEEHASIVAFLIDKDFSKDELLDLRFFYGDILCEEINTTEPDFLNITTGTIAIAHDSFMPRAPVIAWIGINIWYIVVAIVVAVATVLLTPKPDIPNISGSDLGGSDSTSATNKLGESNNVPRINQRIDDVFGRVTKHTPPLWQVPFRIGIDDQETEILLLCIGRGKYDININEVFDGDVRYKDIPNANFHIYNSGNSPLTGTPDINLTGELINHPIAIYKESTDLNPAELLPPNDVALQGAPVWHCNASVSTCVLTLTNSASLGITLSDEFSINDYLRLTGCIVFSASYGLTVYSGLDVPKAITAYDATSPDGTYLITAVTATTVTINISASTALWQQYVGNFILMYWHGQQKYSPYGRDFYTLDESLDGFVWYYDTGERISLTQYTFTPDIGGTSGGSIGPIGIPHNTDKVILNFVASSGYYKLIDNEPAHILIEILVFIEEVDINGTPTGVSSGVTYELSSNFDNTTSSVYRTVEMPITYEYCRLYAKRQTLRDKTTGISNVDRMEFSSMYSVQYIDSQIDFGDVTLMHCLIPSNSQSRLTKQRKTNLTVTRKITQYFSGGTLGPAESYATDDFAQILIHMSLDPRIGRLTLADINADGWLALSTQIKAYFGEDNMVRFGYDFDNRSLTYQDSFVLICSVVNCLPYVQNGIFDAFFERKQPVSSMQVTCRNKMIDTESREQIFERKYDGVEVSYRSEITSVSETIYIPSDRSAINPDVISLSGCTTEVQAFCHAARTYNKQTHSRFKVSFNVDEFGRNIIPAQRIDSPDSTRFTKRAGVTEGYRVYDGEVVEVEGLQVELSEPVVFTVGEDHYIVFTKENGDNSETILCTYVSDYIVLLNTLPAESIYDGYSQDRTKYVFMSEQLRDSVALMPQTIEFSLDDDGNEINTIGSINYTDLYYKDDIGQA
jgi:hypothetical protein